jgi:hypothetical protein
MNDLIEALQILSKYGNYLYPTHCEHEELTITPEICPDIVSREDIERLEELGFFVSEEGGEKLFKSFKFGGC